MAFNQREHMIKIGKYYLNYSAEIGSGTFGAVYEAYERNSDKTYAAKMIRVTRKGKSQEHLKLRVVNEIRALLKAKHENIVNIYHFSYEIRGCLCIIMELCIYGDMQQYLEEHENIDLLSKMRLKLQCANGLAFIHHQGIVHRDLKLGNILIADVDGAPMAKIADFGYCKHFDEAALSSWMTTLRIGTSFYRAPELFNPHYCRYTKSVDIFSLGLVFMVLFEYNAPLRYTVPLSGNKFRI